jgi:hypothetical protein
MSGKVLKPLLIGAAIIAVGVATGGIGFGASFTTTSLFTGATVTATTAASTTLLGGLALSAGLASISAGVNAALAKTPHATLSQLDRLNASINPSAPRKTVFGRTAMATDIRYVEPSGTDQEYIDHIIAVAAHKVTSIQELWIDDLTAWTLAGGVTAKYLGYLTVEPILEGTASNYVAINGGAKWGATRRLTGCAYLHIRIKRTGNSKKAESPFVSGLSSRLTVVGEGMPVYDPRLDSTVPGGSGPQRATDQSTWSFNASFLDQGNNPALQVLAQQIGWRINGKLSVGAGTPISRINLASYITAANLCDEAVMTASGTTQKRYTCAGVFGEDTDSDSKLTALAVACNGALRDGGGKLSFIVRHNDLGAPDVDLTDDDAIGPGTWEPVPDLTEAYNVVRGRYCDPSPNSLYQLVDYPEVRLDSPDGVDRILTLDLPLIDNAARAQRLAKQVLERRQYQGKYTGNFGARAWNAKVGSVVRFTLSAAGWVNKPFRVEGQGISIGGSCPMILREEAAAIYAWDADDRAPVTAAPPTVYDPLNSPLILGINQAGTTANWTGVIDDDPATRPRPFDGATVGAPPGTPVGDREAQAIVDDLERNGIGLISEILRSGLAKNYTDALTTLNGLPIGTLVENWQEQTIEGLNAIVQTLSLIGAKSGDSSAFIVNLESLKVSPDQSLGQKLDGISTTTGTNTASISFLLQAVTDLSGGQAKAVIQLDVNGNISGITLTNDGTSSAFNVVASQFSFVDDSGAVAIRPLYYEDGALYMDNVYIKKLAVGVVTTANIALNQVTTSSFKFIDFGSAGGATVINASTGVWNIMHLGSDTLTVQTDNPVIPAGSDVNLRMFVILQRTGGDNDRVSFRLMRDGPTTGTVQIGNAVPSGMTNFPQVVCYEWDDEISVTEAYSYWIEARRDDGGGTYISGKLIIDAGKR